ncbi:MAG TPA: DUF2490 domain-containing protein [Bryobacteraceae bacterium]|nr:DUF2490 domain-containing protein [Bryobacteraceae bacterium]
MKHRISKWCVAVASLLSLAGMLALPAAAQEETAYETWPEVNAFVKLSENSRLFFLGAGTKVKEQGYSDGALGVHVDIFTSPVLKSRLERTAHRADVARNKFVQLRIGYLYSRSAKGSSSKFVEHTPTFELSPRFYLAKHVLVTSRVRGDLRLVDGVFTPRLRFREKVERSFHIKRFALTPYAHAETFYDWRYDVWHRFRYSAGAEWELNRHVVLEGYYLRQRDNRASTRYLNAIGIALQLYVQ